MHSNAFVMSEVHVAFNYELNHIHDSRWLHMHMSSSNCWLRFRFFDLWTASVTFSDVQLVLIDHLTYEDCGVDGAVDIGTMPRSEFSHPLEDQVIMPSTQGQHPVQPDVLMCRVYAVALHAT